MTTIIDSPVIIEHLVSRQTIHRTISENDLEVTPITEFKSPKFDPKKHLNYKPADKQVLLSEIGITDSSQGISPVAVTSPFPLFTPDAVAIMRAEILNPKLIENYGKLSWNANNLVEDYENLQCVLRGYAKDAAPFTYQAWTHPQTVEIVSEMAGVELQVAFDYEVAHVNLDIKTTESEDERALKTKGKDDMPALVGWHRDSYPFVCVLMLSDTTNMTGGGTYMRKGNGEISMVEGPKQGHATVLQGRVVEHLAPKPTRYKERITMVTSYRPKDIAVKDETVLGTVRPETDKSTDFNTFYPQFVGYRCDLISQNLKKLQHTMISRMEKGEDFVKSEAMLELKRMRDYINWTLNEMVVPDQKEHYENYI